MVHHRRGLRRLLDDDALLADVEEHGYESSSLDERRKVMLRYVETLTLRPASVTLAHVETLRAVGFTDEDILAIVEVTGYYAYVNRVADGLGVTVESWIEQDDGEEPSS